MPYWQRHAAVSEHPSLLARWVTEQPFEAYRLLYLARLGQVMCQIALLEQHTIQLVTSHKADTSNESYTKIATWVRKSTFGRLVTELGRTSLSSSHLSYLMAINDLRRECVHRGYEHVPFPGELENYLHNYNDLVDITDRVCRHFEAARLRLPFILERGGVLRRWSVAGGTLLVPAGVWQSFYVRDKET